MKQREKRRIDGHRLRFVLSTGRTGTTQFREFLKRTHTHLGIAFEPEPSRLAYLLWNAERSGLMFKYTARKMILNSKFGLLNAAAPDTTIVEFDSYLSPLVCEFLDQVDNLHIVHMIRHPYTWIQSMGNFKAASWRRYAVDFVPFTDIVHPDSRQQWRGLSKYEKLAWSWRYVNEQILLQEFVCKRYMLVKFEDFTSPDNEIRKTAIDDMLGIVDPDYTGSTFDIDVNDRLNKSFVKNIPQWKQWPENILESVRDICGPLMNKFGYETHD